MEPTPMYKFNFPRTIMGVSMTAITWSLPPGLILFWVAGTFMSGLVYLAVCGLVYWFLILRLTEWALEVIPPKFFQHLSDWVIAGDHLYVTNDSVALPLSVPDEQVGRAVVRVNREAV